jgi:hypothetical protein
MWPYLENLRSNERSQAQKTTYCAIPFMGNFQHRPMYRDRKEIGDCLGVGETGVGGSVGSDGKWVLGLWGG